MKPWHISLHMCTEEPLYSRHHLEPTFSGRNNLAVEHNMDTVSELSFAVHWLGRLIVASTTSNSAGSLNIICIQLGVWKLSIIQSSWVSAIQWLFKHWSEWKGQPGLAELSVMLWVSAVEECLLNHIWWVMALASYSHLLQGMSLMRNWHVTNSGDSSGFLEVTINHKFLELRIMLSEYV